MKLPVNEGKNDRFLRLVAGVVVLAISLFIPGLIGLVLLVIAAILVFTGATGFCLLYKVFGINTCTTK